MMVSSGKLRVNDQANYTVYFGCTWSDSMYLLDLQIPHMTCVLLHIYL